jgi:D-beta-D-heptose 7-phosphate kinase/D-beta-D-heptose 1-phosphate adenosyltransferase
MNKNVLVIGDLIIDKTYYVQVKRISPEAPVPTAELLEECPHISPGGAGFAAAFSSAQGNKTILCSSMPNKTASHLSYKYNISVLLVENISNNITKTRFIDKESGYHMIRLDNDLLIKNIEITPDKVLSSIEPIIKGNSVDVCLLADYKKGFFNTNCRWHELIDYLSYNNIPTLLDTRMENIRHFMDNNKALNKNLWLKLNKKEAELVKYNLYGENSSWDMSKTPRLLITQGSQGLTMISEKGCAIIEVPIECSKGGAPDTTGCGDIFDISFLEGIIQFKDAKEAAKYAVKTASKYAWIPFKEKLCLA